MYFYEKWDNIYKAKVAICQVKFLLNFRNLMGSRGKEV